MISFVLLSESVAVTTIPAGSNVSPSTYVVFVGIVVTSMLCTVGLIFTEISVCAVLVTPPSV